MLPRPPSWISGGPTSKGEKKQERGKNREKEDRVKREGKRRGGTNWGRRREGKGDEAPQLKFLATPLTSTFNHQHHVENVG